MVRVLALCGVVLGLIPNIDNICAFIYFPPVCMNFFWVLECLPTIQTRDGIDFYSKLALLYVLKCMTVVET